MIQLIITVTIIAILSGAVFTWIDPLARIGEAKNKKRSQDVNIIAAAISDYMSDHKGVLPILGAITTDKKILCSSQSGSNLSCSGENQICLTIDDDDFYKYLGKLPHDPDKDSNSDSGYFLQKDANNNLIVGSCETYNSEEIIKKPNLKVSCSLYAGGYCWYASASDYISCNEVCTTLNLDCINRATYGPDLDSDDNTYCALQKNVNSSYCTAGCLLASVIGNPAVFNTLPSCEIQNGPLNCSNVADQNDYPVCPCE